ncbi:MAG TPA: hypothetical protein VEU52_00330, partial [Candidatus Limnocylindrales bacterium]|nr:hypothetical protein [Candidatus Limnocylindrales bacterium]
MSIVGIASNALFSVLNSIHRAPSGGGNFQQIQSEFLQLGKDLQAGNLTQAQQDFSTLAQNFPATQSASNSSPLSQAFGALSQDLQNGNLSAARQDYATFQQDLQQQNSVHMHHHHHHYGGGQMATEIRLEFSSLGQALQAGNLQAAQSAFAALQ